MIQRRRNGFTLLEVIISAGIIALVSVVLFTIFIQTSRVYSRTSVHFEPQASQMLAMKIMKKEILEGMAVSIHSEWMAVEVIKPLQEVKSGVKVADLWNGTTGKFGLQEGEHICFFIGKLGAGGTAVPDATGNTIFMVKSTPGYSILPFGSSTTFTKSQYRVIIDDIIKEEPDPQNPSVMKPFKVFEYWPVDDNGTPQDSSDDTLTDQTALVKITLGYLMDEHTNSGVNKTVKKMQSQVCVRNLRNTGE